MIQPLLPDKHCSSLKTDFAESFLVVSLQVSLKRWHIWKLLLGAAIVHHAVEGPELQTGLPGGFCVIEHVFVFRVLFAVFHDLLLEELPGHLLVVSDDDLIEVCLANRTLCIL